MSARGTCFALYLNDPAVAVLLADEYFGCVRRCSNLLTGGGNDVVDFLPPNDFAADSVDFSVLLAILGSHSRPLPAQIFGMTFSSHFNTSLL